jgi:hypothetical protein
VGNLKIPFHIAVRIHLTEDNDDTITIVQPTFNEPEERFLDMVLGIVGAGFKLGAFLNPTIVGSSCSSC